MRNYKYEPLCKYLSNLEEESLTLSFSEISQILNADLPPCLSGLGYKKRLLWSNNPKNYATRSWLEAGYIYRGHDKERGNVTFEKNMVEADRYLGE